MLAWSLVINFTDCPRYCSRFPFPSSSLSFPLSFVAFDQHALVNFIWCHCQAHSLLFSSFYFLLPLPLFPVHSLLLLLHFSAISLSNQSINQSITQFAMRIESFTLNQDWLTDSQALLPALLCLNFHCRHTGATVPPLRCLLPAATAAVDTCRRQLSTCAGSGGHSKWGQSVSLFRPHSHAQTNWPDLPSFPPTHCTLLMPIVYINAVTAPSSPLAFALKKLKLCQ